MGWALLRQGLQGREAHGVQPEMGVLLHRQGSEGSGHHAVMRPMSLSQRRTCGRHRPIGVHGSC